MATNGPVYGFDDRGFRRAVAAIRGFERSARPGDGRASLPMADPEGIPVKNNGASEIPAYGLMVPTGDTTLLTQSLLLVERPSVSNFSRRPLVAGPQAIPAGETGSAQFGPIVKLAYDTGTPVYGESFGMKPATGLSSKGYPANCFVYRIFDSTLKIVEAEFLPITTLLGKSTGSIAAGSSATTAYRIYHSATPGAPADAGFTTVPSAYYFVGSTIASDKWIQLDLINGIWYINPWECG